MMTSSGMMVNLFFNHTKSEDDVCHGLSDKGDSGRPEATYVE